jgi:hypothetical protein
MQAHHLKKRSMLRKLAVAEVSVASHDAQAKARGGKRSATVAA